MDQPAALRAEREGDRRWPPRPARLAASGSNRGCGRSPPAARTPSGSSRWPRRSASREAASTGTSGPERAARGDARRLGAGDHRRGERAPRSRGRRRQREPEHAASPTSPWIWPPSCSSLPRKAPGTSGLVIAVRDMRGGAALASTARYVIFNHDMSWQPAAGGGGLMTLSGDVRPRPARRPAGGDRPCGHPEGP